ncbi:alanine--tRNA ligase, mitochondrial isoform X1 [Cloeon dipterum]|uniref:alanine--tRNA ligase, mitochondrial isoform X1 n=2 Tax=Cloeon dipterum TaxID=197152 RepID=UPI00321F7F16
MKFPYVLRGSFSSTRKYSSFNVRKTFVEHFVNKHDHQFIKSSSVLPRADPSLSFVNAGMNQFKSVLLGTEEPAAPRVVNSQKCIRVGGKHNDLDAVGRDGTHHTFFEMLGNWSFADYFKEDACKMAWDLLTGPYNLDKEKLVVTYFGGDQRSNLKADQDCADIWRSIGLKSRQIIPNGMSENFWEMGPVGPCGPCTEIYYNKGGKLMELWNLVFVEYERKEDGLLYLLPKKHVDTGMGLERLSRVLQKVDCNYDTDLFQPLFEITQKVSGKDKYSSSFGEEAILDTAYRILADHSRAISIAMADGIFPDQNYKLRKLVRKCFALSINVFQMNGNEILPHLVLKVTEILGETYPELRANLNRTVETLDQEYLLYLKMQSQAKSKWEALVEQFPVLEALPDDHPGLEQAVLQVKDCKEISAELAFHLHTSLGVDKELIEGLAKCFNIPVDLEGYQANVDNQKKGSRATVGAEEKLLSENSVPPTGDDSKYYWEYKNGHYIFPEHMDCKMLALIQNKTLVNSVKAGSECDVVTDHTHFYHEAGGQVSDVGRLCSAKGTADIVDVQKHGKYVLHKVKVLEGVLRQGDPSKLSLDCKHRLLCMQHHSATHLLYSALRKLIPNTYQRSCHVTQSYLTFDFTTPFSLKDEHVETIEEFVNEQIELALPIKRRVMSLQDLPENAVKRPGEHYPDIVSLITMGKEEQVSSEPCCGTHCNNTSDLLKFCILSTKSFGTGVRSVRATAGNLALTILQAGKEAEQEVLSLQSYLDSPEYDSFKASKEIKRMRAKFFEHDQIPLVVKRRLESWLKKIDKKVTQDNKNISRDILEKQVKELLQHSDMMFVVSAFYSDSPEPLSLLRAQQMCSAEKPSLFISRDGDGCIRGRSYVPDIMLSEGFNAETWMQPVLNVFQAVGSPPKGKENKSVWMMKVKSGEELEDKKLVTKAVLEAENYARASLLLSTLKRKQ